MEAQVIQHLDILQAIYKLYKAKDRTKHFQLVHWMALVEGVGLLGNPVFGGSSVCVYVRVYLRIYIYIYVYTPAMHCACACVCTHSFSLSHTRTHMHARTHTHTCTHTCAHQASTSTPASWSLR